MSEARNWRLEITDRARVRVLWIVTAFLDGGFLVLWVAVQLFANRCIAKMEVAGPDRLVVAVFQWAFFPISTLAPIAVWIYRDVRVMIVRAQRTIAEEKQK